jgi:ABC-type uncharacterized transport system permease subunit
MSLIRLNTRPTRGSLRTFGFLCLAFLLAFGAIAWRKGDEGLAVAEVAAGGIGAGCALFAPDLLRLPYLAAIYAGFPIGFAASYVILTGVYFLVLTPAGLVMRACGRDPLGRRREAARSSYWAPRDGPRPGSDYFHQS